MAGRPLRRLRLRTNGAHGNFVLDPTTGQRPELHMYRAAVSDTEHDGVMDIDRPTLGPRGASIEEVRLAEEVSALVDFSNTLADTKERLDRLFYPIARAHGSAYSSRAKTPYSLVNKLRRKGLVTKFDETEDLPTTSTLTDLIGGRFTVEPGHVRAKVKAIANDIRALCRQFDGRAFGALRIMPSASEDYYAKPQKSGYRGLHLIIRFTDRNAKGEPVHYYVEIQIRGRHVSDTADWTHGAYKAGGDLDTTRVFELADIADETNSRAAHTAWLNELDALKAVVAGHSVRVNGRGAKKRPALEVQSILFDRTRWTPTTARAWLADHGHAHSNRDMDITDARIRVRQIDPARCERASFRTGWLSRSQGIQAVFARRK